MWRRCSTGTRRSVRPHRVSVPKGSGTLDRSLGRQLTTATREGAAAAGATRPALMDLHGRHHSYLRISLTERCNLRCVYCMPEEGVALTPSDALLTTPELIRLASLFVDAGVTKIRFTGGEPTLRKDLEALVTAVHALRPRGLRTIALTSNGLVLHRSLSQLHRAGLDAVNISLDTLNAATFERLARRPGLPLVMRSIETALQLQLPLKVNCVVMRGVNDHELIDFVRWTKDAPLQVRFIEYMPFEGGGGWQDSKCMSMAEMLTTIQRHYPTLTRVAAEDGRSPTSKTYGVPGWPGRVGFISSMSDHFCSSCNRVRLLADGALKACLFGPAEVSLRDALRAGQSDTELLHTISQAIQRKQPSHGGMQLLNEQKALNRPMILIGG